MKKRMNWEKLLSMKRVADFDECKIIPQRESQYPEPRSAFEKDYDQLIFSYPFRRLQDKTQVIPFPEFDFVHTRLTHSLEVASVGRSLGKLAAKIIFEELPKEFIYQNKLTQSDIGALVAASCLAHDIGNPPFGHSGEDSISYYFTNISNNNIRPVNLIDYSLDQDTDGSFFYEHENPDHQMEKHSFQAEEVYRNTKKWSDLIRFEGNANGFKIITSNCEKGINPTAALLGTFTKYPRESWLVENPFESIDEKEIPKSQRKYGFFYEQRELFYEIAEELGLIAIDEISAFDIAYKRHPLAFLMEAADDISYQMIDFEDGCRLCLIDFDKSYTEIEKSPKQILIEIAGEDEAFDINKLSATENFKESISYLRSKVINVLIHSVFEVFSSNYEKIMSGNFDKSLVDCIRNPNICKNLTEMKKLVEKYIYNYRPVLESEAGGFEVMGGLIESFAFTSNICFSCGDEETSKQSKLRSLLPIEYRPETEIEFGNFNFDEKYKRILRILDYVSGMTDNYAVSLYRKIKGISIPH